MRRSAGASVSSADMLFSIIHCSRQLSNCLGKGEFPFVLQRLLFAPVPKRPATNQAGTVALSKNSAWAIAAFTVER
jgi:hypothetical protein